MMRKSKKPLKRAYRCCRQNFKILIKTMGYLPCPETMTAKVARAIHVHVNCSTDCGSFSIASKLWDIVEFTAGGLQ